MCASPHRKPVSIFIPTQGGTLAYSNAPTGEAHTTFGVRSDDEFRAQTSPPAEPTAWRSLATKLLPSLGAQRSPLVVVESAVGRRSLLQEERPAARSAGGGRDELERKLRGAVGVE
jgi:hypothetical protein